MQGIGAAAPHNADNGPTAAGDPVQRLACRRFPAGPGRVPGPLAPVSHTPGLRDRGTAIPHGFRTPMPSYGLLITIDTRLNLRQLP